MAIDDQIRAAEQLARQLEPPAAQRELWWQQVGGHAEAFLQSLSEVPAFRSPQGAPRSFALELEEQGSDLAPLLQRLAAEVDAPGINPASGGHMGYIPGGGIYPSALADYLADITNRFAGVHFASPGAAAMEQSLGRWLAELAGLPAGSGGDLTSGGSLANLGAVVTAREASQLGARQVPDCCIYLTAQVHHCVNRALHVAGLGEARLRIIPMDQCYRMEGAALEKQLQADAAAGLKPFMLVASAGTTDTGAIDPLPALAELAERYGLWFHVDAAYGGFFRLCEDGSQLLAGMERADSVVMDPHKGLFLPYGSGALLVRDLGQLAAAHRYDAAYMQDALPADRPLDPADLSTELSRPFRGLRLWLPLRLFGLAPFRAALEEKRLLARYFYEQLSQLPGWELGPRPELSVVTYRYVPAQGDADAFNQRLMQAIHADGRVFVTSTQLDGRFTLRLALLHFRTHKAQVDLLLECLKTFVEELENE